MPKYKLAEYRYGREEMLALYIKDNKVRLKEEKMYILKFFVRKLLKYHCVPRLFLGPRGHAG